MNPPTRRQVEGVPPVAGQAGGPKGPWLVLLIGLVSSIAVTWVYARLVQSKDEERFENSVTQLTDTIHDRLATYDAMLRGVVGLYTSGPTVSPAVFERYVRQLGLGGHLHGIQGIGFAERVPAEEQAAFERRQRALPGRAGYTLRTESEATELFPITHLEPQDRPNRFALGFDMYGEARRRQAMELARDTGEPCATSLLTLVQELDETKQPGLLVYYPVYATTPGSDAPPVEVAERRARLTGFVFAPFRAGDLLHSVFGNEEHPRVDFDVYDGERSNVLYGTSPREDYAPRHSVERPFPLHGRTWTLAVRTRPDFEFASGAPQVPLLLLGGILISLFLFRITGAQALARADAERNAALWARAEERFATTLASIGDGVIATDRAGIVTFANPVAEALTGSSAADALGRPSAAVLELVDEETREPLEGLVDQVLREGRIVAPPRRAQLVRRDGSELAIEAGAAPIRDKQGALEGIVIVLRDVSLRRRDEAELARHRERLEELVAERTRALEESHQRLRLSERMAALGTLSAGLGHDMGNLLLPVRIRLDTLAGAGLGAAAQAEIAVIQRCVDYLQRLSNGLRLFALDPSDESLSGETTDVAEWWADVEPFFKSVLPRGIEIDHAFPPGLARVRLARHALTQAVFNLVQNAGDAMRARGHGRLAISAVAEARSERVRILVEDDGPGMTEEVRQRCLEPFFTTKAREISTGLGLALVHGIVQKAGGTLAIESEVGVGTRFVLALPAARERAPREPRDRRTLPVAVVDVADARIASFLAKELGDEGFEVRLGAGDLDQARLLAVDEPRCDARALGRFLAADEQRVALVFDGGAAAAGSERSFHLPRQLKPTAIRAAIRQLTQLVAAESPTESR